MVRILNIRIPARDLSLICMYCRFFWHDPVNERDPTKEPPTLQACFKYLDLTSRSFSTVIQELNPELLVPVTLFYLCLRGLDTIEDDLTIDIKTKEPLLRDFHKLMVVDGWTFDGNGPDEKDRELLVNFDNVVTELKKVKKPYFDIINDITIKMGNGMADYAINAEFNSNGVDTIKDYEKYCHYVAGLVGDGLTRLFLESKLANERLMDRPNLTESMGQFLQKTNIIRDIREDFDVGRRWWPKEIWSKYVDSFPELFEPQNRTKAVHCLNHMVLNALKHAEECLFYMAAIRDQSVFNFVAIPQSMAIATLELVFNNPAVFDRNIKITKGDACSLMTQSTQNLHMVTQVFKRYARRIHQKNDPRDPNYLKISMQCGRIEQFIETLFPEISPELAEKKRQLKDMHENQGMDVWDGFLLTGVVVLCLFLMGGLMVSRSCVFICLCSFPSHWWLTQGSSARRIWRIFTSPSITPRTPSGTSRKPPQRQSRGLSTKNCRVYVLRAIYDITFFAVLRFCALISRLSFSIPREDRALGAIFMFTSSGCSGRLMAISFQHTNIYCFPSPGGASAKQRSWCGQVLGPKSHVVTERGFSSQ